MAGEKIDGENLGRWRRQRNFFLAAALGCLAAMGLIAPGRVAKYRELKQVNARLVGLQAAITDREKDIRSMQTEILNVQREIAERSK